MYRSRFLGLAVLSLILTGAVTRPVSSYEKIEPICTVYSLAELGDDPNLCKWVADTIPQVIQPDTWGTDGEGKRCLTYYAPAKILVVYHTAAVHDQVDAFLKNVKKTLPQEKATAVRVGMEQIVQPARFVAPQNAGPTIVRIAEVGMHAPVGYPVPPQVRQPKHLFHFIIRYEGEGLIDDNVSGMCKEIYGKKAEEEGEAKTNRQAIPQATSCAPQCVPLVSPPSSAKKGTEEEGEAKSKDKDGDDKSKGKKKETDANPTKGSESILLPSAPAVPLSSSIGSTR